MTLTPDQTRERVRAAISNTEHWEFDSGFGCWTEPSIDAITDAVLDALAAAQRREI